MVTLYPLAKLARKNGVELGIGFGVVQPGSPRVTKTLERPVTEQTIASSSRTGRDARLNVQARLTWKDADGALRFTSVRTREISETGAIVDCEAAVSLPLFRLVHMQVEKTARNLTDLPASLREGRVLSAVWQVAPCRPSTGTPSGYRLRFMIPPAAAAPATLSPARRAS